MWFLDGTNIEWLVGTPVRDILVPTTAGAGVFTVFINAGAAVEVAKGNPEYTGYPVVGSYPIATLN